MENNIYIQETGYLHYDGKSFKTFKLFEYRENEEDGKGFQYSRGGKSYYHFWAYPKEENKLNDIPVDILFSFKHGSCSFKIDEILIEDCNSIEDIIRSSDFKFISKEEINIAKITESITTIENVKQNWEHIKKYGANPKIAEICLKEAGFKIPEVRNGEIGIHTIMLLGAYNGNLEHIEQLMCS